MSNAFNTTRRTFANFNHAAEDDDGHFEQTFIKTTKPRQPKQKHPMAGKKPHRFDKREYAYSLHTMEQ